MKAKTTTERVVTPAARQVFAAALRERRTELGLSQEVLADLAEVHRTYVGQIERAEKNVSIDSMEKLAAAVGLPLWKLLQESGEVEDGSEAAGQPRPRNQK